jgi:hypothetical protein
VIYIAEAHALDSRSPMTSGRGHPLVQEPVTLEERKALAGACAAGIEIARIPTLVDLMDDAVNQGYSGWPDRLFLVGRDGRIAYAGGRGPFGFKPDELEGAIKAELKKDSGGRQLR